MEIIKNLKQTPEKTATLFSNLQQSSQLKKVLNDYPTSINISSPLQTVSFDLTLVNGENEQPVNIEVLFAKYDENTIIAYERTINTEESNLSVTGHFVTNENFIQVRAKNEDEVSIIESEINAENLSFFNLIPDESTLKAQDLFDGCLVFLDDYLNKHVYKHCGKACGDGSPIGGGTPINSLDTCCRAHDRCYSTFGFDDCGCDDELEKCAGQATNSPGWKSVYMWAGSKSCKK